MAMWEKQTHKPKRKVPSFSSSLLDAIYHSTDESTEETVHNRRRNSSQVEEEIESLRRAIRVEKWMDNHSTPRHFPSNSGSSTDSSLFSSSETDSSASKSTPRSSLFTAHKPKKAQTERPIKNFKSKAIKIYGELKEPISPGGKIANFLNSIFSPRNLKNNQALHDWSSIRKSRSMKDAPTCSLATSKSCLSKNPSAGGNKSKRSVRFCPVTIIVNEDSVENPAVRSSMAAMGSKFIKRNVDGFRVYQAKKNVRKNGFREIYDNESDDGDDKSCASSDLFELENIGRVGIGTYEEELPVYGTTSLEMNQAIASGLVV